MKTLKRIQIALLVSSFFILGTTLSVAQSSKTSPVHPPSEYSHLPGDISSPPDVSPGYLNAGLDATICKGESHVVKGFNSMDGIVKWVSSGDGIFDNPENIKAIYQPGEYDKYNGTVTLSLVLIPTSSNLEPSPVIDTKVLTLENCSGYLDDPNGEL